MKSLTKSYNVNLKFQLDLQ